MSHNVLPTISLSPHTDSLGFRQRQMYQKTEAIHMPGHPKEYVKYAMFVTWTNWPSSCDHYLLITSGVDANIRFWENGMLVTLHVESHDK